MNAGETEAAAGRRVLGSAVFLASAAGWLRAGRRAVSAGGGLPNGSKRPLTESANGVAATSRWLAVAVCAPDELSRGTCSSDWPTIAMWSASLSVVASGNRPGVRWRCRVPFWFASACSALTVDQKLVADFEMRCSKLLKILTALLQISH
jgi:hypothetical protein